MADRRQRSFFLPMLILAGVMLVAALLFLPIIRCDCPLHSEQMRKEMGFVSHSCQGCRNTGRLSLKGLWDRHRNTVRITYGN